MRWLLSLLLAATATGVPVTRGAEADTTDVEVYFEVKLLVRERVWGRSIQVDQWTGGRVSMRGSRGAEETVDFNMTAVVESPWTFRWYPTKNEAKLGAAVHVERVEGDPYGALAPRLEALARSKYSAWWDADPAAPGPPWSAETGKFWARRHAREEDEKDPLPEHSTYPFHVLGSLRERFGFTLRNGTVEQVVERVTQPWLTDGWTRARAGEAVEGYGFWDVRRPRWEPRTYEAFAAALNLLGPSSADPVVALADLLATMQPRAARLCRGWRGDGIDRVIGRPDLRYRTWRAAGDDSDELQILVDDTGAEAFKLWVRVGYRAAPRQRP